MRLYIHAVAACHLLGIPAVPWEVGGWLLGYWTANERNVVITHATPPASRGTPFGVLISGQGHRAKFDEAWDASDGNVTFLGDWHTHPGGPSSPSCRDRQALDELACDPAFGTGRPLALIVQTPRWVLGRATRELGAFVRDDVGDVLPLDPQVVETLPDVAARVPAWHWPRTRRAAAGLGFMRSG